MRVILVTIGNKPVGEAYTWAYPEGKIEGIFIIPTYEMTVEGTNDNGQKIVRKFEVLRFGVLKRTKKSSPRVVGLAEGKTYTIKNWLPKYSVHSAASSEDGAWQVYGDFLIHDGPDNPLDQINLYATIGCVAITGEKGFVKLNKLLLELSGASGNNDAERLKSIGISGKLKIKYEEVKKKAST